MMTGGTIPADGSSDLPTHEAARPREHAGLTTRPRVAPAPISLTRVRLGTTVELQVARSGSPDGTPVLFLHGYTDSWFSYSLVLDRLPAGIHAIVPTQRGHGDSEHPDCCYRIADFAADALALLDALRIPRATIVGHSNGSFVAQRIAIERPERVDRLVLVGSGTTTRTESTLGFNPVVEALVDPIPAELVREFQQSTVVQPVPAAFLDGVVAESRKVPARVWRACWPGLLEDDAKDELHRIRVPTLVLSGAWDELWSRAEQDRLAGSIRGARLVVYEETGHAPHWERPDRFAADLLAFLDEVAEPAPAD